MLEAKTLRFQLASAAKTEALDIPVRHIICAGYSGRSQDAVQAHVQELIALGMPAPTATPIFFKVSNYLATTGTNVTVQDKFTSGEVEFVLVFHKGETFVTCGSDHTHRGLEKYSIPGAKQMHPKILAPELWRLVDVAENWDRMVLRSWATVDGVRNLYQEATLAHILAPGPLLEECEKQFKVRQEGSIFMSGTIPTTHGLVYADHFAFELHDPSRNRTIHHSYDVSLL
jgi:uncharacterized protein DUF2848